MNLCRYEIRAGTRGKYFIYDRENNVFVKDEKTGESRYSYIYKDLKTEAKKMNASVRRPSCVR